METELTARVARLEREARVWRFAALVAFAGFGVALTPQVTAQGEGTAVKAPFTVTDETGAEVFTVHKSGKRSKAILHGADLGIDVQLTASDRGADVYAAARPPKGLDGKGVAISLEANRNTGPEFRMNDEEGKTIVRLPSR